MVQREEQRYNGSKGTMLIYLSPHLNLTQNLIGRKTSPQISWRFEESVEVSLSRCEVRQMDVHLKPIHSCSPSVQFQELGKGMLRGPRAARLSTAVGLIGRRGLGCRCYAATAQKGALFISNSV